MVRGAACATGLTSATGRTFKNEQGLALRYIDHGPREAPALLFLAGVGSRLETFSELVCLKNWCMGGLKGSTRYRIS